MNGICVEHCQSQIELRLAQFQPRGTGDGSNVQRMAARESEVTCQIMSFSAEHSHSCQPASPQQVSGGRDAIDWFLQGESHDVNRPSPLAQATSSQPVYLSCVLLLAKASGRQVL
jgi:hypothetical protein